jgi:phospholipid/cholesterol/gamma-HCH transport system substrate-binding protein
MKISNETKIGALTAVAITLLILGFNFLKGKNIFKRGNIIYAKYTDTKKLMPSNPVFVNGYQVGSVYEIEEASKNLKSIIVAIKLKDDYSIPSNSIATISSNPLSSNSIEILLGNSSRTLKRGDTIQSVEASAGMFGELTAKVGPVADQLEVTLRSFDDVLKNVNSVLDPNTKGNLQAVIYNLNRASAGLVGTTAQLQQLLNTQTGALAKSLNNVETFTGTLASNKDHLNNTMTNLDNTTSKLAAADIQGMVQQLKNATDQLNITISKLNSPDGSLGALVNDRQLYNNLNATARSMNILMDDIRVNPKRYVSLNFSLLGSKKTNDNYLTAPLVDTVKTK